MIKTVGVVDGPTTYVEFKAGLWSRNSHFRLRL